VAETYVQHLTRGGELLRADRVDEARAELEAARVLRPSDIKILSLLGLVYFRLGLFVEARTIYDDLVLRQPRDASLRLNLGLVYLKLGEVEKAIGELSEARRLDPSQTRTVGYLGLAYARSGQYARAREAFLQAGQDELAREMEQYLAGDEGVASKIGEPLPIPSPAPRTNGTRSTSPPPVPADAIARAPVTSEDDDAEPDPHQTPTLRLSTHEALAVAAASRSDLAIREPAHARVPGEVVTPQAEGIVTAAVRIAAPQASLEHFEADGRGTPQRLSQFATSRLIRPDDGELPFELAAGDTLIVRVRGRVLSRTEGVVVSGGELAYEPATKRVRGRMTDEPFGTDARPMFLVSGHGHLCASPRGGTFTALELVDDALYVREELLFAFEERLRWENGHIPGSADKMHIVQFRGEGCVALRTPRPTLTVKLAPDKVIYVDAALLAGWIGRVVPRVVAPAAGGDASAPFVECSGEGVIIALEPQEG
jgi:uncharacterized protein (AIM24 family)